MGVTFNSVCSGPAYILGVKEKSERIKLYWQWLGSRAHYEKLEMCINQGNRGCREEAESCRAGFVLRLKF